MKPLLKALAVALGLVASMWLGSSDVVAVQDRLQLRPGDLLVTDITDFRDPQQGGRLVKVDRDTGEVTTLSETPKPPNGMALERVGDVLHVFLALGGPIALGGQERGDVVLLTLDLKAGQILESRLLPIDVVNPTDIEIDPTNGDLIIADAAKMSVFGREGTPGNILRVEREPGEPRIAAQQRTIVRAEDPQGVAIDRNSNILYSDTVGSSYTASDTVGPRGDTVGEGGSSYIKRIRQGATGGGEQTLAEIPQSNLSGVALGPDGGSLWVTTASCVESSNGQVIRPLPGEGVEVLTEGLDSPRDIALDPARPRTAFITSFLGGVVQLDLETGERATFAREGLNHPNYVQVVPEAAGAASAAVADEASGVDLTFASAPIDTTAAVASAPTPTTEDAAAASAQGCASGFPSTSRSPLSTVWTVVVGMVLALGAYLLWWR